MMFRLLNLYDDVLKSLFSPRIYFPTRSGFSSNQRWYSSAGSTPLLLPSRRTLPIFEIELLYYKQRILLIKLRKLTFQKQTFSWRIKIFIFQHSDFIILDNLLWQICADDLKIGIKLKKMIFQKKSKTPVVVPKNHQVHRNWKQKFRMDLYKRNYQSLTLSD